MCPTCNGDDVPGLQVFVCVCAMFMYACGVCRSTVCVCVCPTCKGATTFQGCRNLCARVCNVNVCVGCVYCVCVSHLQKRQSSEVAVCRCFCACVQYLCARAVCARAVRARAACVRAVCVSHLQWRRSSRVAACRGRRLVPGAWTGWQDPGTSRPSCRPRSTR